jgi:hypothetical protein
MKKKAWMWWWNLEWWKKGKKKEAKNELLSVSLHDLPLFSFLSDQLLYFSPFPSFTCLLHLFSFFNFIFLKKYLLCFGIFIFIAVINIKWNILNWDWPKEIIMLLKIEVIGATPIGGAETTKYYNWPPN